MVRHERRTRSLPTESCRLALSSANFVPRCSAHPIVALFYDKRAGGAIGLIDSSPGAVETLLRTIRHRLLSQLHIDEQQGRLLLHDCPVIQAP